MKLSSPSLKNCYISSKNIFSYNLGGNLQSLKKSYIIQEMKLSLLEFSSSEFSLSASSEEISLSSVVKSDVFFTLTRYLHSSKNT